MKIKHKIRFLLFFVAYLIMVVVVFKWELVTPDVFTLKYMLRDDHCDTFQVFYSDGYIWNETAAVAVDYYDMGEQTEFSFDIPYGMTEIRIDLGNIPGKVEISDIRFVLLGSEYYADIGRLLSADENHIPFYSEDSGRIIVDADNDSYFVYNMNYENNLFTEVVNKRENIFRSVLLALTAAVMILLYRVCDSTVSVIKSILRNKRLIINLSLSDFKAKYAGSQLGIVWAFVQPSVTALIYIFVFQVIGRAAPVDRGYPYSLWLLPGLIPWFYFSESVSSSTNSLAEYSYLVKKIMFNTEILPVVKIISCFFVHIFLSLFVFVVYLIAGVPIKLTILQVIYYMLCNTALAASVGYLTCALLPFYKDMMQIVNLVLMVSMWACPIMWDMNILPPELNIIRKVIMLNPMYYIVNGFRESYMGGDWFIAHPMQTIYFWSVVVCLFVISSKIFKKLQPHFSDVL